MEVGLLPTRNGHITKSVYITTDKMDSTQLSWIPTEQLPVIVQRVVWIAMTGCSPRGYLAALKELAVLSSNEENYSGLNRHYSAVASVVGAKKIDRCPIAI